MIKRFAFFLLILNFFACSVASDKENSVQTINISDSLLQLNQQLTSFPTNADLYYKRAVYYFNHNDYELAYADVSKAIDIDSTKSPYYVTLSDIYFRNNKTRNAKMMLEKAIVVDPKNTEALLKLAELYFFAQKYQEAFDNINKALKVDEHIALAYFMKGMIYKELKDTTKAISSMNTAVEQDQEYYAALMQLGLLYSDKKDKLAIDYFNNALRIMPKSEEAIYAKGKFYQDIEDWDNAMETYQQLLRNFPNNQFAYYNMGFITGGIKNNYETAIKNFDAAIKIAPEYFQAYYGRGTCYEMMGDKAKAIENYKKAVEINPDYIAAVEALKKLGTN